MDLMDYVKELFDIGFVPIRDEHSELFNSGIYDDYLALKIICMENTTTDVYIAFDPDTFEPKGYEIFGFFIDKKDVFTIKDAKSKISALQEYIHGLDAIKYKLQPFIDKYNLKEIKE